MPRPPVNSPQQTVIVGISGGVDSAVAALLLRDAGYSVQGLFMSNWEDDDAYCTAAADFQDARRVCEVLGIALHRVSFAEQYRERVFTHFLHEYAAGRTPNPDVLCNREIKFGVCLDYMLRLGAAQIATGHYARIELGSGQARLLKAADAAKDQSYFLHSVASAALSKTLFPLGDLHKAEVRRMAHAAGLPVFDKPDSTGICFIGERPFQEFLSRYLRTEPGPIETAEGRIVGEHRGLCLYTLGQRSGLNVGGRAGAAAAPWYVADKITVRNALIVVQDQNHPLLMSDEFGVEQMHWIDPGDASALPLQCSVKTRYRQADLVCQVGDGGTQLHVKLARSTRAVTPGQYAVFYRGERCLGGGIIANRFNSVLGNETRGITYNSLLSMEGS
ncbi:MAG TPA: tRNA 2-thiouridine(34) synthase MnmA [Steroidobacteraceae bacterium]|jgi:tRNA-specific 2-thiouridylase|nr:tRNA 2-thiouridine(34) synthase MnmA [Steroidobacteraceae bacterium]